LLLYCIALLRQCRVGRVAGAQKARVIRIQQNDAHDLV
jgi:hypothetical protein